MNVILKRPARPVFHPIRAACGYGAAQFMLSFVGGELKATVPRSTGLMDKCDAIRAQKELKAQV